LPTSRADQCRVDLTLRDEVDTEVSRSSFALHMFRINWHVHMLIEQVEVQLEPGSETCASCFQTERSAWQVMRSILSQSSMHREAAAQLRRAHTGAKGRTQRSQGQTGLAT
jgi:hypothetical protein